MQKSLWAILLSLSMSAPLTVLARSQTSKRQTSDEPDFKVGQVWSYKTRIGEEGSYFIVVKIDTDPKLGTIIHVALRGLRMKNPHSPDGISEDVNHMPFSKEALTKSATMLLKTKSHLPKFEEGYEEWRDAFNAGNAGIYTIPLAEAVKVLEVGLNQ